MPEMQADLYERAEPHGPDNPENELGFEFCEFGLQGFLRDEVFLYALGQTAGESIGLFSGHRCFLESLGKLERVDHLGESAVSGC
jgi:hypothetical protein